MIKDKENKPDMPEDGYNVTAIEELLVNHPDVANYFYVIIQNIRVLIEIHGEKTAIDMCRDFERKAMSCFEDYLEIFYKQTQEDK